MSQPHVLDELTLVDRAQSDPVGTATQANELLESAGVDPRQRVIARWARGLCARELDQLENAERDLTRARDEAIELDARLAARVALSLALVVMYRGESERALDILDSSDGVLDGAERGRMLLQRGLIRQRLGQLVPARADFVDALELVDAADPVSVVRILINTAVLDVYEGHPSDAIERLHDARRRADDTGQPLLAAFAEHNLGYANAALGDLIAALDHYDRADARYAAVGEAATRSAVVAADRAAVLLAANLLDEADRESTHALEVLSSAGHTTDSADTALVAARVCLALDDRARAADAVQRAADAFGATGRTAWLPMLDVLAVRLAALDGATPELARRAERAARSLVDDQWLAEARSAMLVAGRIHLAAGENAAAAEVLAGVKRLGPAVTPTDRAGVFLADGLLAEANGDDGAARRATTAGLSALWSGRLAIAHYELRAHAMAQAVELGSLGARLAVGAGRGRELIERLEATRRILAVPPAVRAPRDAEMRSLLVRLRLVTRRLGDGSASSVEADELVGEQQRLERAIGRAARRRAGGAPIHESVAEVFDALRGRVLVEFAEVDGELWAASFRNGRAGLTNLGPLTELQDELDALLFAFSRLQRAGLSEASEAASWGIVDDIGCRLERLLPATVRRHREPVVIVPSPAVAGVCWRAIPCLRDRAISVAPTATVWSSAARRRVGPLDRRPVLVAGPGLRHAEQEVRAIEGALAGRSPIALGEGRVAEVTAALVDADLAHFACHGRFRSDNALFSSLHLVDGELNFYDLEQCARLPQVVVISACDVGQNAAIGGGALLGMASALLQLGVATVIAPLTPVNDERSVDLMARVHGHLAEGAEPADALARACVGPGGELDPTGAPFVCFGS